MASGSSSSGIIPVLNRWETGVAVRAVGMSVTLRWVWRYSVVLYATAAAERPCAEVLDCQWLLLLLLP
jgi:hypothetical protein